MVAHVESSIHKLFADLNQALAGKLLSSLDTLLIILVLKISYHHRHPKIQLNQKL